MFRCGIKGEGSALVDADGGGKRIMNGKIS